MTDNSTENSTEQTTPSAEELAQDHGPLIKARREKLDRWREAWGITGYGHRVDGIIPLAEARGLFDRHAHDEYAASAAASCANRGRSP